ncbi:MAG: glycoside hydrolase family 3 C-terminal domain-containing protein [Candidatus Thorarchaeota archaeon]|nr:MAG: glycoside hydrolase family 3 C-terminal domain-containing protein [Candidatus Thorarchaeota archaeon]
MTELLSELTTKEKFMLLTSHGRHRIYTTKPIGRVGIPSFKMTDGPLGAAYHSSGFSKNTRFPATISLAATWDRRLAHEVGVAMGKEVRALGRHMLLAPGINIHRTPLNGRTFEYYSEDPFLTKELAIPFVKGVQSQQVGACLKHYAANNQETDRRSNSSEVDERTLHEIYLRAFRAVVKAADPWAVMACYNMVNGVYGSENRYLLREVLMDRWGFKGFVMTDWFATRNIETTEGCVNAGLSLEMPWPSKYKLKSLQRAYSEGKFTYETLEDVVRRYTRVMFLAGAFDDRDELPQGARNTIEHQELARRSGEEGMVLLKNKGGLLPLDMKSIDSITLLGPNLKKKYGRILSGGSSAVVPPYEITPLDGMREKCKDSIAIVSDVSQADVAIVFAGLGHGRGEDSETTDRRSLSLPENQEGIINQTAAANRNTVVVLMAGSPIAMSAWIDNVPAVLMAWYPGMEGGRAIVNVLFGDVNPSGRLPLTFPKKLSDSPAHSSGIPRTFPGVDKKVYYDEGIFVGYRWFDEKGIDPLFPFGFGQSYTSFEYRDVHLNKESLKRPEDVMQVELRVANVGQHAGSEVVQMYSHDVESLVPRPPKELIGFEKVQLGPGEEKNVVVNVNPHDLAFYDISQHDWLIEPGAFEILVGRSSQEINTRMEFTYG